jgi:hypothetical protein
MASTALQPTMVTRPAAPDRFAHPATVAVPTRRANQLRDLVSTDLSEPNKQARKARAEQRVSRTLSTRTFGSVRPRQHFHFFFSEIVFA